MKYKKLISFKRKQKWYDFLLHKEVSLNYITGTTNIAIFGGTGTGKTTSICYPLLNNLINNKCSGLILDVKGDYSNIARHFNRRKEKPFFILGIKEDCERFNIISGISSEKLKAFIKDALYEYSLGQNNSTYWGMNGIEDTILIYELLKALNEEINPTLADLYFYIINNKELKNICLQINVKCPYLQEKIDARVFSDSFSVFNFNINTQTAEEQRTWQLSRILAIIKPFYESDILRYHFCNNENVINYWEEIYINKRSFTLELPSTKYPGTALFCLKILKSLFINTIREQPIESPKSNGYGDKYFTFMLIDEYQQFLNPTAEFAMNDNNWFDISRGYGHINIISTQSIDSLIDKSSDSYVHQLIGNTRNIIHLSTNAKYSLEHIKLLSNTKISNQLLHAEADLGFMYIGKNQLSRKSYSAKIITAKSKHTWMNHYIKNSLEIIYRDYTNSELVNKYDNKHYHKIDVSDLNEIEYKNTGTNIWNKTTLPSFTIESPVSIITSQASSQGFKDFNFVVNKLGIEFENLNVYSVTKNNQLPMKFYNSKDSQTIFKKNSIILYIRGGGDMKGCFLNDPIHISKIKEKIINKKITIGIGYGHLDDEFFLVKDKTALLHAITPSELARELIDFYKLKYINIVND